MAAKSLSELCDENNLTRSKSAKCFYQCLVLVGGGFLDASQDLRVPYGEIVIRPGGKFGSAYTGGGGGGNGDGDGDGDDVEMEDAE